MIIADPYGSWTAGAHAGINDALAIRRGADTSAMTNYGLQRMRQFDPYELEALKAKTRMEGVNADIAQQYGLPMAQANLNQAQARVPFEAASYGALGPLFQYLHQYDPNTVYSREGGMQTQLPGPGGELVPYTTPTSNIRSPQDLMMQLRAMGLNSIDEYRQVIEEIRQRDEMRKEGVLSTGESGGGYLKGLPIPASSVPAPNGNPTGNAPRAPNNPSGQFDYGLPTGQFNTSATTALGPMTGGFTTNPTTNLSQPSGGNPFTNVRAGSSSTRAPLGANIYSDIQDPYGVVGRGVPNPDLRKRAY